MAKSKAKSAYNTKSNTFKTIGLALIALAIIALVDKDLWKSFDASFEGSQAIVLVKMCIALLPGSLLLSYGITLGENGSEVKLVRVSIFSVVILVAALVLCGWVNLFVNFGN